MSTSDSVAMRVWPIPCVPLKFLQLVVARDRGGVAQVLDQLQGLTDRQDLDAVDILDVVDQPSKVAVIAEEIAEGVFGRLLLFSTLAPNSFRRLSTSARRALTCWWMSKPCFMSSCSATLKRMT